MYTVFQQAYSFLVAAERCMEERKHPNGQIQMPIIPSVVNATFACELYLKGMLDKNNIDFPYKHDLKILFNLLPCDIRNKIECVFQDENIDFEKELDKAKDLFIDWRYLHQKIATVGTIHANLEFLRLFMNTLSDCH